MKSLTRTTFILASVYAVLPTQASALRTADVQGIITEVMNAINEEYSTFVEAIEATGVIPSDAAFGTLTSGYTSSVSHTASNEQGTAGNIVWTFNAEIPTLNTSTIKITYNVDDGKLLPTYECTYAQNSAPLNVTAALLDPDGSTTFNLFNNVTGLYTQSCV